MALDVPKEVALHDERLRLFLKDTESVRKAVPIDLAKNVVVVVGKLVNYVL